MEREQVSTLFKEARTEIQAGRTPDLGPLRKLAREGSRPATEALQGLTEIATREQTSHRAREAEARRRHAKKGARA